MQTPQPSAAPPASAWAPLAFKVYRVLWLAVLASAVPGRGDGRPDAVIEEKARRLSNPSPTKHWFPA